MRHAALVPVLLALLLPTACREPPGGAPGPQPKAGGAADLVTDGAIFGRVATIISGAGDLLEVEMYEFGRADLADLLVAARRRGVRVRVVLDPTVSQDRPIAARLAGGGVPVRWYPVDDRRGQIDHVKLLLGDRSALVGGMNWGGHSAANHDYAVEDRDEADLVRLAAIFDQDWSLAGGRPAPLAAPEAGGVFQTAPGAEIRGRLESAIAASRSAIEAEVFAFTDPAIVAGLAAARRRGVQVRVLLDPGEDVNRPTFDLLTGAGVDVRWFRPAPGAKLHAKIAAFDDLLLLGSANWSRHGLDVNHELDLAISGQSAVAAYRTRFEIDWNAAAR